MGYEDYEELFKTRSKGKNTATQKNIEKRKQEQQRLEDKVKEERKLSNYQNPVVDDETDSLLYSEREVREMGMKSKQINGGKPRSKSRKTKRKNKKTRKTRRRRSKK